MSIRHPTRTGAEKRDRTLQIIGVLILLVLVGILIALVARGNAQTDATAERAQNLATQVRHACEQGGEAAEALGSACAKAKQIQATPVVGETGEAGPPGPPPSDEQVQAAVTAYCASHTCRGEQGARGPGPSASDVAQAVAMYCDARGECQGTKGDRGEKGDPPTAEQLAQAVAAYCAPRNECRGATGEDGSNGSDGADGADGEPGADGDDGRGIESVECRADGTWVIRYDDGTTQTATGPCRARLFPSP